MAVKTYRLVAGLDGNYGALSETDQTAATLTSGWTVAKVGAGVASDWLVGLLQGSGSFGSAATTKPLALFADYGSHNLAKIPAALTGTFAATAWTFTFAVRATTASAQAGRVRVRVFKNTSADPFEAQAVELTTGAANALTGTTSSALSTTADVTTVVTWSPGAFTLASEYLFFAIAWEITTAGGNNSANVFFRTGQSAAGTRIVTADLSTGAAAPDKKPRVLSTSVPAMRAALR